MQQSIESLTCQNQVEIARSVSVLTALTGNVSRDYSHDPDRQAAVSAVERKETKKVERKAASTMEQLEQVSHPVLFKGIDKEWALAMECVVFHPEWEIQVTKSGCNWRDTWKQQNTDESLGVELNARAAHRNLKLWWVLFQSHPQGNMEKISWFSYTESTVFLLT